LRGRGHGDGQESQREAKGEGEPATGGLIHCFKTSVAGIQALLYMRCLHPADESFKNPYVQEADFASKGLQVGLGNSIARG
jgi:hypothetical protein